MSEVQGEGPLNLRERLDNSVYARTLFVAEAKAAKRISDYRGRDLPRYRLFARSSTEEAELDPFLFEALCRVDNGVDIAELREDPVGTNGLMLEAITNKLIPGHAVVERDGMYVLTDAARRLTYAAQQTTDAKDPITEAREASDIRRSISGRMVRVLSAEKPDLPH